MDTCIELLKHLAIAHHASEIKTDITIFKAEKVEFLPSYSGPIKPLYFFNHTGLQSRIKAIRNPLAQYGTFPADTDSQGNYRGDNAIS